MSEDWDSKLVIGYKRDVAKVAKKDSDVNGSFHSLIYAPFFDLCWQL
jgi:putative transcription factor